MYYYVIMCVGVEREQREPLNLIKPILLASLIVVSS